MSNFPVTLADAQAIQSALNDGQDLTSEQLTQCQEIAAFEGASSDQQAAIAIWPWSDGLRIIILRFLAAYISQFEGGA